MGAGAGKLSVIVNSEELPAAPSSRMARSSGSIDGNKGLE